MNQIDYTAYFTMSLDKGEKGKTPELRCKRPAPSGPERQNETIEVNAIPRNDNDARLARHGSSTANHPLPRHSHHAEHDRGHACRSTYALLRG